MNKRKLKNLIEQYEVTQASYTRALTLYGLGFRPGKLDGTGRSLQDYKRERGLAKKELYDYINAKEEKKG